MDADDICEANRLKLQKDYLEKNNLDLVGGSVCLIDENGNDISNLHFPCRQYLIKRFLKWGNCIPHPTWLVRKEVYTKLNKTADSFFAELQKIVDESGRGYQVNHICSLGSMFCTTQEVYDYETAKTSDTKAYADYCNYMQNHGIYLAPAQFEAMFISAAHTQEQLAQTLETARNYFKNN